MTNNRKSRGKTTPLPKGYEIFKNEHQFYPAKTSYDDRGRLRHVSYYQVNDKIVGYSTRMHALTFLLLRYAEDQGGVESDETIKLVGNQSFVKELI